MADLLHIYTIWLTIYSISFTFIPMLVVMDWKKRGSADGFSSLGLVLPLLMMCCWCRLGVLTSDPMNTFLNGFNIVVFSFYVAAFAYYQPKRRYLYGQLTALAIALAGIFYHVSTHPEDKQPGVMGTLAAGAQIASMAGAVYDIKRAISLKTTEYIPAPIQFGIFAITLQWLIFGLWVGNYYIAVANMVGLALSTLTLTLYTIYPPRTWRVPILGVGGTAEKKKVR